MAEYPEISKDDFYKVVLDALKRGHCVEIKKEHGKLVLVEISRKVKYKEL